MTSQTGQQIITIHVLPNISLNFQNQTLKTQLKFQQIYFMQPFFTFSTTKKNVFTSQKSQKVI